MKVEGTHLQALARRCVALLMEVLVHLVVAAVFKTVGPQVKPVAGGFDSHALPPFFRILPHCIASLCVTSLSTKG